MSVSLIYENDYHYYNCSSQLFFRIYLYNPITPLKTIKYFFQPDLRNYVTDDLVETFGFGKNVKPVKDMDYNRHKMDLVLKQMNKEKTMILDKWF